MHAWNPRKNLPVGLSGSLVRTRALCPRDSAGFPVWKSTTRRGLAGVWFEADTEEDASFRLVTLSGTFEFTAKEIREKGRIVFPVGPKYLSCNVIVTRTGYYWFRPSPKPGQVVREADDLADSVPVRDWARMRTAWIAPGKKLAWEAEISESSADFSEPVLHLVGMAAPNYTPGNEKQVHAYFPMRLYCDGKAVADFTHYFREHDDFMQMLEDVWVRFQAISGKHRFELQNRNEHFFLLVNRLILHVTSKVRSENKKNGMNLTAASKSKSPISKRQRTPRGSKVSITPITNKIPKFRE